MSEKVTVAEYAVASSFCVAPVGAMLAYRTVGTKGVLIAQHTKCDGCACKCHGRAEKRGTGYILSSERDYA